MNSAFAQAAADYWLAIKNVVYPQFCRICEMRLLTEENGYFCPRCWEASALIRPPVCSVCGRPHGLAAGINQPLEWPCEDCRETSKQKRAYRRVFGAALYDGAIGEAIRLLKFQGKTRLAEPLAETMRSFAKEYLRVEDYDLLVPVPLYSVRLRERGFNQATLLAEGIVPCFPNAEVVHALARIRPTRPQSLISGKAERKRNVRGAFQLRLLAECLQDKHILLIDDVITTGDTVAECALALRAARPACVDAYACALPVRRDQMLIDA